MQSFFRIPILILLTVFISNCKSKKMDTKHSVYYWKTILELSQNENDFLKAQNINKIYLRFFDIGLNPSNNKPYPVSPVILKTIFKNEITPTIFIKNEVFKKITKTEIEVLAENTISKINSLAKNIEINEIQIDCDWSLSTSDSYFYFLKKIKEFSKLKTSATIRLHQIKFFDKTGVPPVNEGTLMVYNTGDWKNIDTKNSIFDAGEIVKYLDKLDKYPLKLNLAFPIFDQTIIYRSGKFFTFIRNITLSELSQNNNLSKINDSKFKCEKDFVFKNLSLRNGDIIRYEKASERDILKIKKLIFDKLNQTETEITLFDLNEKNISAFEKQKLAEIYSPN